MARTIDSTTQQRLDAANERFRNQLESLYMTALSLANEIDSVRVNYKQGRLFQPDAINNVLSAIGNANLNLLVGAQKLVTRMDAIHQLDREQYE